MSTTDRDEEVWRLPRAVAGENLQLGRRACPSPAVKARLRRIVDRTPEVMVKITGRTRRGAAHLKAHLDYITRNGRLVAERDDGTP